MIIKCPAKINLFLNVLGLDNDRKLHNLYLINQIVKFTYKNQDMVGIIQGLDDEGRLIINSRGEELHITSGEITLHNEYQTI